VYDKLQSDELAIKGAERKTDLELLCLKHSQRVTDLQLRWVHSEAQIGNALTKGQAKELEMYYNLHFHWRLVSDEQMRSARKRRQEGLDVLQQVNGAHTHKHRFPLMAQWDDWRFVVLLSCCFWFCFVLVKKFSKSGVAGMQVMEHLSHTVQTMAVFRSHLMSEENRLLLGSTPLCRVKG
jgi:hypothetical protein